MKLLDLGIDAVLSTTRNVRKRLDLERPVERSVIEECLEIALQAPNGSNNQGWEWIFVDDAAGRRDRSSYGASGCASRRRWRRPRPS